MQKNTAHNNDFTQGNILSPLIRFTFPILLALLLQSMYGAVDLLVVGRFGDASSLSAVSTGSTMMQIITMVIAGFTMGATVLIGRYIGAREPEEAGRTVGAAICLFALMAVVLTVLMLLFAKPFARVLQVPQEAFDKTIQYVIICGSGTFFIVGYNVISGIFRGIGNSRLPLVFVAIACVVNIVGDLLLTGLWGMDVAGVAIATIAAQAVSVLLSFVIIRRQPLPFRFTRRSIRFHRGQIRSILHLGYPIALQDTLTNISFLTVNSIINGMGLTYSAGYGVAQKVISFILLIPSAYMSAMSAFVAQNMGAKQPQRAKRALLYGIGTALGVGVFMFLAGFFGGGVLSSFFATDPLVIDASANYIQGFSFDCIMTSVLFCLIGYFNGCGRTRFVMAQGLVGAFLVRIPLSYLFSLRPDVTLFHMGLATPVASLASIVLCLAYFFLARWNRSGSQTTCP